MNLSPLNFSGLIATDLGPVTEKKRGRAVEIVQWSCSECCCVYDDEDEAAECCGDEDEEYACACPVCGTGKYEDARDASDCCLWKDIDAPTRWKMADAVDAGSTWAEQLGVGAH